MNLILLYDKDLREEGLAELRGRRLKHVLEVHRAAVGDRLRVGLLGGEMGNGEVQELTPEKLVLRLSFDQSPPPPLPVTLLLALPRPKMLKRILQCVTALGVKQIYLVNSYRVEKSFWGSPLLQPEKLRDHLILGLEQARDTILPEVHLKPRFKPFVEDELPALVKDKRALVAHPVAAQPCPALIGEATVLAIGPEGGFIPYEVEKLQEAGFEAISLGERILRVETAVPVLLSRFFRI